MSLIPGELAVMCMYEKNGVHVYLPYMEMKPLSSCTYIPEMQY